LPSLLYFRLISLCLLFISHSWLPISWVDNREKAG